MMQSSRDLKSPSQDSQEPQGEAAGAGTTAVVAQLLHEEKKEDAHTPGLNETQEQELEQEDEEELVAKAMTLNVAYESLELVRKLNLQAEFGESVDVTDCTQCLRENLNLTTAPRRGMPKWMARKRFPCLTCGSQVCHKHRSTAFNKQNIAICNDCAPLFSVQYILKHVFVQQDVVTDARAATVDGSHKKQINQLLEIYDRSLLILKYSDSFMEDIAAALEKNTSRHNRIGVGTSATGIAAGMAGVAAAATILTPVGPPLLLASILFGGTSTAVTAGSEAVNYRAEPNVMADRILTLHGVIASIVKLPCSLDNLEEELEEDMPAGSQAAEENQSSLHYRRTVMNVVKPLTAGALSAVSIVTESREMRATVEKIRAGNPCEKANMIRDIHQQVAMLPETQDLARFIQESLARRLKMQQMDAEEAKRRHEQQVATDADADAVVQGDTGKVTEEEVRQADSVEVKNADSKDTQEPTLEEEYLQDNKEDSPESGTHQISEVDTGTESEKACPSSLVDV